MKHKVIALNTYETLNIKDNVLNKVLPEGFEFEVDDDRLKVLLGANPFKKVFVKLAEEVKEEKQETEETPKPKKRKSNKK